LAIKLISDLGRVHVFVLAAGQRRGVSHSADMFTSHSVLLVGLSKPLIWPFQFG